MCMTFKSCRIAAVLAAFFLSHSAVAQEEDDSKLPVPAPVKASSSDGVKNVLRVPTTSYLSFPRIPDVFRCGRGVYSDNCFKENSRPSRDVSALLFPESYVLECRSFLRAGFDCVRVWRVR